MRQKVAAVNQQIQNADQEIANALSSIEAKYDRAVAEEAQERKRAIAAHRRVPPPCRKWTIQSGHGESPATGGIVNGAMAETRVDSFKIVCGGTHR